MSLTELTTDSVPEPPRENTSTESRENASVNGHLKSDLKENSNEKKKKEKSPRPSKSKTPKTPPDYGLPPPSAGGTTTININAANNVQFGNVINVNIGPKNPKASSERKEKYMDKPRSVSELIASCELVTEDDLDIVSSHVGSGWKTLGKKLGFSDGQLEQIEENCKRNDSLFKERVYQMLLDWKQYEDCKATVGVLCKSLWKAREYDAAIHLAKERSSE